MRSAYARYDDEAKGTLHPDERRILRRVKTTPAQARKIKRRNACLLMLLDGLFPEAFLKSQSVVVKVGCPHCHVHVGKGARARIVQYLCSTCDWNVKPLQDDPAGTCGLQMTFGGVSYGDLQSKRHILYYSHKDATLWPEAKGDDRVRTFLLGHVEWANSVIKGAK